MTKKAKSTYYIESELLREMHMEAVKLGIRFPSDFIKYLWKIYKKTQKNL